MASTCGGDTYHVPVLADQVLALLSPHPGGRYIDMTLGGGGHTLMMLEASAPDGHVLGLDRDPAAIASAGARLAPFGGRAVVARRAFDQVAEVATRHGFVPADGILMDVGVSSRQLNDPGRGFSFRADGPLDMRMDPDADIPTAADLVNTLEFGELARVFRDYGEERHAKRIARAIVRAREDAPFTTTARLANLIEANVPRERGPRRIHPATRVFQALRIAVNDELGMLDRGLDAAFGVLAPGGRLAVISFHSLEDRMVKQRFREWSTGCVCPPAFPICQCGRTPLATLLTRRAQVARPEEVEANPRARSAKLRAVTKQPQPGAPHEVAR